MSLTSKGLVGFFAVLLVVVLPPVLRGDDYTRGADGDFSNMEWGRYSGGIYYPPPQGPPGPGDTADLNNYNVTANSGSVMMLGGMGSLTVTGTFSAMTASGFTLKGAGTFTAGSNTPVTVDGGHLQTGNDKGKDIMVSDGGEELAAIIASGTQGLVSGGGSLSVAAGAIDLNLTLQSGGTASIPKIINGQSVSILIDGSGSELTVANQFLISAGFLDITNGGALTCGNDLSLDGMGNIGGGGHWSGAGTKVTSTGALEIGNAAHAPGFSLSINSGAKVSAAAAVIGNETGGVGLVNMDGAGTDWTQQSGGLIIGENGQGTMNLTNGAHLAFTGKAALAVGDSSNSNGTLTADGKGSLISVAGSGGVLVGTSSKSNGTVTLSNGAQFTTARTFGVGVAGNGTFTARSGSKVTLSNTDGFLVGTQTGSYGSLGLQDAKTTLSAAGPITIGYEGHGYVSLATGAKLTLPYENLILGYKPGSTGEMDVSGTTFVSPDFLIIGEFGTGIFNATFNAAVTAPGFDAPVNDGAQATVTIDDSDVINTSNAKLGTQGVDDPPSTMTLQNNASMDIAVNLTIYDTGTLIIDSKSQMTVGSGGFATPGTLLVGTGGSLAGAGHVMAKVVVAGGTILPGDSPGILNITGSYTQQGNSTYSAEIGGTDPGSGYDQIKISGPATLGGTLRVRLVKGFTPAVGQTFRLLSATSKTGSFTTIIPPSQAGLSLTNDATGVTAKITSVVSGAPVIDSPTTVHVAKGVPFSYQINATNSPTSFGATNLPPGLGVNHSTGYITGTPTKAGASIVAINANNRAGSGQADLNIVADPIVTSATMASNLANISTRLEVQGADNVLIAGFIVTGTSSKEVLIRGLGPSLGTAGVKGALANPVLTLHKPDGSTVTNDNWMDTQKAAIMATGIAPKNNLESAILATLPPGAYTAVLTSKNNSTGIGLVEVYDLNQTAAAQLANISTRGFVQTGDNVMIGGFIVGGGGGGSTTLLVRAIGPSLGKFGISNPLKDPTLELHDSNGAVVGFNNNWKDAQEAAIKATKLEPTDNRESAIEIAIPPGPYTAIVRGANNTTGVGTVEAYTVQ